MLSLTRIEVCEMMSLLASKKVQATVPSSLSFTCLNKRVSVCIPCVPTQLGLHASFIAVTYYIRMASKEAAIHYILKYYDGIQRKEGNVCMGQVDSL